MDQLVVTNKYERGGYTHNTLCRNSANDVAPLLNFASDIIASDREYNNDDGRLRRSPVHER